MPFGLSSWDASSPLSSPGKLIQKRTALPPPCHRPPPRCKVKKTIRDFWVQKGLRKPRRPVSQRLFPDWSLPYSWMISWGCDLEGPIQKSYLDMTWEVPQLMWNLHALCKGCRIFFFFFFGTLPHSSSWYCIRGTLSFLRIKSIEMA